MYHIQKYILVFLLGGAALAINPWLTTDVYEFPKFLVLIAATTVLTISVVVRGVHFPKIFIWIGIFLVGNIIAFAFSKNPTIALAGAPFRFQGFLSQLYYILLLGGVFHFFSHASEDVRHSVMRWLVIILGIASFIGFIGYVVPLPFVDSSLYFGRVYGTFGNPNYLAAFIIGTVPFLMFAVYKRNFAFFAILVLSLMALFFTGSRSAWAALLASFLFFGIIRAISRKQYTILAAAAVVTIGFIFLVLFQRYSPTVSLERFSLQGGPATSVHTRASLWSAGIKLFFTRPLTGYGQDTIKGYIEPFLPRSLRENDVFFIDRTHSELIDILVTTGIIGAIGYIGFFGTVFWQSTCAILRKKITDPYFDAAFVSFVALFLFHAVNFGTITSNILFYFLAGFLIDYHQRQI